MNRSIRIILILAIATITGCYYDSEEILYPTLYNPCDDTVVTFSGTVKQIIQPCMSCHSNSAVNGGEGGGIKLENHADILKYVNNGKLMGSIRQDNLSLYIPMPQGGGKLPDCEISQLQKWIDNGALNN